MSSHGLVDPRGLFSAGSFRGGAGRSRRQEMEATGAEGRFGELFTTDHRPPAHSASDLTALGVATNSPANPVGLMVEEPNATPEQVDNPGITAGFTFLGQFVDHDLTFDTTSLGEAAADVSARENFRTARLDLDSVYGAGPNVSRHLYGSGDRRFHFVVTETGRVIPQTAINSYDVPRLGDVAVIGDPRNDENLIISQIHASFLKFHNFVLDDVRGGATATAEHFEEASTEVRWHWQWLVAHQYLDTILGPEAGQRARAFDPQALGRSGIDFKRLALGDFMPVEFAGASFRFGHTQVRPGYRLNADTAALLFPPDKATPGLRGGQVITETLAVDFRRFFAIPGSPIAPALSRRIDTKLAQALFRMPAVAVGGVEAPSPADQLSVRNLLRGQQLRLPAGQWVARRLADTIRHPGFRIRPLTPAEVVRLTPQEAGLPEAEKTRRLNILSLFSHETPLWFYILKEADVLTGGTRLGPMGEALVGYVIMTFLHRDPTSYLNAAPAGWTPRFGTGGDFTMADLLTRIGAV
ncbi:MAG: peroxidase family protein [Alphaproteobacteria bacterium]|nr:peroxidase family protein [Alphaproteobacteria bacterium]